MAYPVHMEIRYEERVSRLTTFFRPILAIPHLLVLIVYGFVAFLVSIIAWFAILITGRYPSGMFRFQEGFLRYSSRVLCYMMLLTDRYPPFSSGHTEDTYPVQLSVDEPERLSRLTTFFRIFLQIPAYIVRYALSIVEYLMAFVAWWVILITGRLPRGMFEVMELPQRYNARYTSYALLLTTDVYPWFQPESDPAVPDASWNEPLPPAPAA